MATEQQLEWTFDSRSQPGTTWTVTLENGKLHCPCPASGNCWHKDEVRATCVKDAADPIPRTAGGYAVDEVTSALQKSIRRGLEEDALFWATELDLSGMSWNLWRRLKIIASEDVGAASPGTAAEIAALFGNWLQERKMKRQEETLFLIHAVQLLARAPKSRAADNAWAVFYEGPRERREVPDYALDRHTRKNRTMKRGVEHWQSVATRLENQGLPDPYEERAKAARLHPIRRKPVEAEEG